MRWMQNENKTVSADGRAMSEQKPMKSASDVARVIIKHMKAAGRPPAVWINRDEIVSLSVGFSTQQLSDCLIQALLIFTEVPGGNFLLIDETKFGKLPALRLSERQRDEARAKA